MWRTMRNILFVLVGLVAFLTIVNGQSTKKEKEKLSEKFQTLVDSSAKRPVLRYNGNKFREYVTKTPRNYSMIVMFTALSGNFLKEIFIIKTSKNVFFLFIFSSKAMCNLQTSFWWISHGSQFLSLFVSIFQPNVFRNGGFWWGTWCISSKILNNAYENYF